MAPIVSAENDDISEQQNHDTHESEKCEKTKKSSNNIFDTKMMFGIQGWRKRCIFALLFFILCLVLINLGLTLWIMTVMKFHKDGLGPLKISSNGLYLSETAFFMDSLITSSIKTKSNILIESCDNFTINTWNENGVLDNRIFIGRNAFHCLSNEFTVSDPNGKLLFATNGDEVVVGAESLRITGKSGVVFHESVSTPAVITEPGDDLTLSSPTRSLNIGAATEMSFKSKSIEVDSFKDIMLKSHRGAIKLDAPRIEVKHLQKAYPGFQIFKEKSQRRKAEIFQMCVCENGRVFLASADGVCETYDSDFICR